MSGSGMMPAPDVAAAPLNDAFKFFLANMPFGITTEAIRDHFGQFGPVNFVKIIYDKKTGQSRGYGFLYMLTNEGNAAVEAYANSHQGRIELMGRSRVFLARHDQKRELPIRNPLRAGGGGGAGSAAQQPVSNSSVYGPASTPAYAPQQQQQPNGYAAAPAAYAQPAVAYAHHQPAASVGQQQPAAVSYAPAAAAPVTYAPVPASAPTVQAPAATHPGQPASYAPAVAAPVSYAAGYGTTAPTTQYANQPQSQTQQYASNPAAGTSYTAPATHATQPPHAAGASYSYSQPVAQPVTHQAPSYAPQQTSQPASYGHQQPPPGPYGQQPQPPAYPQQPPTQYAGGAPAQTVTQQPPPPPNRGGNQVVSSTKVFLENLPTDVTPKDVVQCLAKYSVICTRCTMEYDKDQKATWCYAHVELATAADTTRVLDMAQRSTLEYRGRILQASIDSLPPADGKAIPVGMGAPISTGPRPVSTSTTTQHNGGMRGSSNDPRNRLHRQQQQQQHGTGGRGRGGGRHGGGRGHNRNSRRDRPY